METLHPSILRCPIPVGHLPDQSGYQELVALRRRLLAAPPLQRLVGTDHQQETGNTPPAAARRYVALSWGAGDEAEIDDGRVSGTAGHWGPFLDFLHGAGWPWIVQHSLDFGSADGPARHWLVCDRETGAGWAMPWRWAALLVRTQDPEQLRQALAEQADRPPGAAP